ncbi:hypothetical protein [Thermoanaerobacterium thermosaccharolyticum]|uniref:hypothetical protein n=1 Tax=Thermoanaerobacterium thermosaccharolyticum TaxID=1517 RepID=UPI0020A43D0A|nr:hypothetical protein [Thermoanaerobacterium thermosaccharolyticum]MCP2239218.1 ABC-type uncharacterized transport system permease subunit [Thermoanaerobacterium thermosaccharolyticum]
MRKTIAYSLFIFAVTAVSIIFMLDLFIKEQPILHNKETSAQENTYTLPVEEYQQDDLQLPVFNSTPYVSQGSNNSEMKNVNKSIDIKQENPKEKNNQDSDLRNFNEKSLNKLIQQRERNFEKITENSSIRENDKSLNMNRIVVTPEKILSVQKEIDFTTKSKAISILMKLGTSGIGEIMKMSQDGVTAEEGYKMMDILKEHLSEKDINFLKSIVDKYFVENDTTK